MAAVSRRGGIVLPIQAEVKTKVFALLIQFAATSDCDRRPKG
jgi:hypothetical protein